MTEERMQRYVCAHCEARPPRGDYMVCDEVWVKVGMKPRGFLCLGCLEKRLVAAGHGLLQLDDFTHAPCNAGLFFGYAIATRSAATELVRMQKLIDDVCSQCISTSMPAPRWRRAKGP